MTTVKPSWHTCPACGKRSYATRSAARLTARIAHPGRRLRAYRCGDRWHLTSQSTRRTAWWRNRTQGDAAA